MHADALEAVDGRRDDVLWLNGARAPVPVFPDVLARTKYRYQSGWAPWISLFFTPETAISTHVFATLHVAGRFAPAWAVRLLVLPLLQRVGRQDQFILEQQELTRRHFPGRRHVVTEQDIARPYLEAVWNDREADMPDRSETTMLL